MCTQSNHIEVGVNESARIALVSSLNYNRELRMPPSRKPTETHLSFSDERKASHLFSLNLTADAVPVDVATIPSLQSSSCHLKNAVTDPDSKTSGENIYTWPEYIVTVYIE